MRAEKRTLEPAGEQGPRPLLFFVNDHIVLSLLQGATIRRDDATGAVIVARIMRGGAADRSGKLCLFYFCHAGLSVPAAPDLLQHRQGEVELI